jgi:3-oxoacyl-[acyl-carrier protein] reductase
MPNRSPQQGRTDHGGRCWAPCGHCQALALAGNRLMLPGRRPEPLQETVGEVRSVGGEAAHMTVDLRDYRAVGHAFNATVERWRRLDVVVPSAMYVDYGPIVKGDPAIYQEVITPNVLGVIFTVCAALLQRIKDEAGHVFASSVSGRVTCVGNQPA